MIRRMRPWQRAIAGFVTIGALSAVAYLGAQLALGVYADRYRVEVRLGDLGQGIVGGSDVVMRGALVGEVGRIRLDEDYTAVAELVLQPDRPIPERATFAVVGKTLLGEKQVEIRFDGSADEGPFHPEGTLIADEDRIVELQDVLADLDALFGAIDPDDLATLIDDGLGAFDGQAALIARSIDQGARGTDVFVGSLDDQVPSLRDLSLVAERLGTVGEEFDRLGEASIAGLPTLIDNQEGLEALLAALERFAPTLDATLTVDRSSLDRMIVDGDNVTRMLFAYAPEVGELVEGIRTYSSTLSNEGATHPSFTGEAARFQAMITDPFGQLCHELPPELAGLLPACADGAATPEPGGDAPAAAAAPVPVVELPVPGLSAAPEAPTAQGLSDLLDRALGIAGAVQQGHEQEAGA